jgi:hypothetical protein
MANEWMYMLPALTSQNSNTATSSKTNQDQTSATTQSSSTNANQTGQSQGGNFGLSLNQIPQWLEDASRAGVGSAQNLLSQPTQAYGGDLTAGLNQYQTQAGNMFQNAVDQFSPYFDQAKSTIQSGLQAAPQIQAQSLKNGLSGISDYMNPYIQNVVNSVQDFSRQNLDQSLKQTADQAIAARAFGGSRHGVQEGVATAQNNLNTNNLVANLLNSGYGQATNMLSQDVQNNLTAQQGNQSSFQNYLNNLLSGGGAIANLGTAAQNSLNTGIGNLLNFGNLAQGTEQNANTAAYNEWMRQQGVPLQLQQLYNQTLSAAPHSTAQSNVGNQYQNTNQNTTGTSTGQSNTNSTMSGTSSGNSNTNSSGWSMSPVQQQSSNPIMTGIGGLMGIGSLFAAPKGGISAMSGIGSALSAGLGFLSDKNMKTDVKKLGKDEETGLDIYSYRYKGDPKTYPKVVGPMAQDIEKHYPGATKRRGDRLTVHPGAMNSLAGKFAGGEASARGLL